MAFQNYRIVVTLQNVDNPVITRTLSVPMMTTFHKFHQALQIAFSWDTVHLYKFDLVEGAPGKSRGFFDKKSLLQLEERPDLYDDMGFLGCPLEKSTDVTLRQVLDDPRYAGAYIEYIYDFGDCWEHTVQVIGTEEGNGVIKCVAGKGRGAQEDCGGSEGWAGLKSIYKKLARAENREEAIRKLNKDDRERVEWFEKYNDGESRRTLDPHLWSMDDVNARLAGL